MDVMSSLRLLFVLAAALSAMLGVSSARLSEINLNNSLVINQKQPTHKILLNVNGPALVKVVTELQSVFRDIACRDCTSCMERAIKAHRVQSHIIKNQPNAHELYYDVLNNNQRKKRNTVATNDLDAKIEKGQSLTATVTKYTKDRKVLAIEIKEMSGSEKTKCKVYSVKKSLSCNSESEIISVSKRSSKKSKKIKVAAPVFTERVTVFTEMAESMPPTAYKKREVDNSQVAESYMPSIEELY